MIAIGIDGGGTKTEIVTWNRMNKRFMKAHTVASNLTIVSDDELHKLLEQGLAELGIDCYLKHRVYCFAGFAGAGSLPNQRRAKQILESLLPAHSIVQVEPDAINGLYAGTLLTADPGVGMVHISGTGSITFGRGADGRTVRVGGYGHVFDDLGSGYSVGHQAIQAILQAYDGRRSSTQLTQLACKHYEVVSEEGLIDLLTSGALSKQQIASFTPFVFEAQSHDQAAVHVIDRTRDDIVHSITTCAQKLYHSSTAISVILTGGLFQNQPQFHTYVSESIRGLLPEVSIESSSIRPVFGALFAACLLSETMTMQELQRLFHDMMEVNE